MEYLSTCVPFLVQMQVNIPYMEHLGNIPLDIRKLVAVYHILAEI